MRIAAVSLGFLAVLGFPACSKSGGGDTPTGPSGPPTAGSAISYTAIGASDANGVGSSVLCIPFADCPTGKGYVYVATSSLRARDHSVTLLNLGIPTAVISQRIQSLGQSVGRDIFGNFITDELPFVRSSATLVTIFAGGNDVNTITAAVGAGLGGTTASTYNSYIDQQVAAFGADFTTLLNGIRTVAPSARIVVLNLPNLGALPFMAADPLAKRQAAQRASVGITTTVLNPLVSSTLRVVDLMCEPRLYQAAYLSSDGFHPNDAGYALLAEQVVSATTAASYAAPKGSCTQMTTVP